MDLLDAPVRLVVKAPNQRVGDQTIDCALNWTVRKLKTYLSEVYPNKPKSEEQKLIYSGQLLHDHLMLKDVLRQYDQNNTHILHLVCSLTKDDVASAKDSSNFISSPPPNVLRGNEDGLRQRRAESQTNTTSNTTSVTANMSTALPNYSMNTAMGYGGPQALMLTPEQMSQQMLWMQQMYTQYMTHYMQYAQLQSSPTLQPTITQQEPQQQPNAAVAPPPNAPAARQANENVRMNAQGGQVIDDDDEEFGPNRDWLDWYQTDWFQMRQRPRRELPREDPVVVEENVRNDDNNNRQQQVLNGPVVNEEQVNEIQEMENLMDNDMDNPIPQIEFGPSIFSVTWTFISGFFASLIPEQPAPIN
uniref:Ubiquitin-like domain-containing protein n=1 Tax=Strigamia maritima TaxID=126957 RepID=T1JKB0_STRMM